MGVRCVDVSGMIGQDEFDAFLSPSSQGVWGVFCKSGGGLIQMMLDAFLSTSSLGVCERFHCLEQA